MRSLEQRRGFVFLNSGHGSGEVRIQGFGAGDSTPTSGGGLRGPAVVAGAGVVRQGGGGAAGWGSGAVEENR
jgi:hypothetical protein